VTVTEQRGWEVSAREDQSTEQIRQLFARYREMARDLSVATPATQPAPGSASDSSVASAGGPAGVQSMRSLTRPK
jgi:hypothetical protein